MKDWKWISAVIHYATAYMQSLTFENLILERIPDIQQAEEASYKVSKMCVFDVLYFIVFPFIWNVKMG